MNRAAFYKQLRKRNSGVFGTSLSQGQVDGCEAILDAGQGLPLAHLAHCLGEAYHETGGSMAPVRETNAKTDESAIVRLENWWRSGKAKKAGVRSPYWRKDADGKSWLGRGYVQLTHKTNYEKARALTGVDVVSNPAAAMRPKVAAQILCEGCRVGMFTGKKLADFDGQGVLYDHYNARAIVNGDKGKNGRKVERYGRAFEIALIAAGFKPAAPLAVDPPKPKPRKKSFWQRLWGR